jgi:hypothetical protein
MARAKRQWEFCGYNEIQNSRKRKGIIDFDRLIDLLGFENYDDTFELREVQMPYGKANNLDSGNTFLWDQPPPSLISQF